MGAKISLLLMPSPSIFLELVAWQSSNLIKKVEVTGSHNYLIYYHHQRCGMSCVHFAKS